MLTPFVLGWLAFAVVATAIAVMLARNLLGIGRERARRRDDRVSEPWDQGPPKEVPGEKEAEQKRFSAWTANRTGGVPEE